MTWFLLAVGLLLVVLGIWGGPATRRRPEKAERIPREATVQEAWDILTSPVEYDEELIKIPDHQPWFLPGGDRRFQRGLAVGLGAGLVLAVLLAPLIARPTAPASPEPGDSGGVVQGPGPQDTGGLTPDRSSPPDLPPAADPGSGANPGAGPGTEPGSAGQPPAGSEGQAEPARPKTVTVTVETGSSSQDIAALLKEAGLVQSEEDFLSVVSDLGVETRLKAGTFDIPVDASPIEIVNLLTQ